MRTNGAFGWGAGIRKAIGGALVTLPRNWARATRHTLRAALLFCGVLPSLAFAQNPDSNVREISCPATAFNLCKDGNDCNQIGGGSPQDVVNVSGVGAGDIVSVEVAHPGQSLPPPAQNITPIRLDFPGLSGSAPPSPDPVTVSQGGAAKTSSYTVTTADASDGASHFLVQIDKSLNPTTRACPTKGSCPKGEPGTIKINKSIIGGTVRPSSRFLVTSAQISQSSQSCCVISSAALTSGKRNANGSSF